MANVTAIPDFDMNRIVDMWETKVRVINLTNAIAEVVGVVTSGNISPEIHLGRCSKCGYHALYIGDRCPKCGAPMTESDSFKCLQNAGLTD